MSASWTPADWERIDEACDRFEAAWKAGQQPQVHDFLNGESGSLRDAVLRELQRVDDYYRRSRAPRKPLESTIAGFEILAELGRGGMGVVYQARQLRPLRLVALKMISRGAEADPLALERFQREAEAVAQLQHPHIVQVYEVGEHAGRPYVALEYVAGGSLDQHLHGTPQPPRVAAELVERLADAIQHAHARGVIHRDLKPANVLLQPLEEPAEPDAPRGPLRLDARHATPKITDFGLAKLLDVGAGSPTRSGDLLGTPSYMAPEQVDGRLAITAATDVYGLGAILYELLSGRPPFRGETALETIQLVQGAEPVSPSRLHPRCPRDLVTICLKCLQKAPQDRYSTAAALAADLRRFLDGQPIHARPVGPLRQAGKWARRQPVIASLAALLAVAVTLGVSTGVWYWRQAAIGLQTANAALTQQRAAQTARVATLGRYQIALAHREWLANNARRAEALLDACTPEQRDSWEWRYLDRMRHAPQRTLRGHRNTVQALAVHPAGSQAASVSHDASVRLWDLQTGQSELLDTLPSLGYAVAFSPDGQLLAAADAHTGTIKIWTVATRAPAGDELDVGGQRDAPVRGIAFDPTSRYLAVGARQQLKVFDLQSREWVYDRLAGGGPIFKLAFSPDGSRIATATEKIRVWDWAHDQQLHEWPGHGPLTHDLSFSPDGTRIASGGRDGLIRVQSLLPEQEPFTLNAHRLAVTSVEFSPDGQRLASSGQEGDMHVWDVEHRTLIHTLHGHSGAVWDLAYTPDGKRLLSGGSDFLLHLWDASGSPEAEVLPLQGIDEVRALAYSGQGRYLAMADVRGRVAVWDTLLGNCVFRQDEPEPGGNPIVMAFSHDGQQLAYRWARSPVKLWNIKRRAETSLPDQQGRVALGLTFSEDGDQLLAADWSAGTLRVRDLRTGHERLAIDRPRAPQQVVWNPGLSRLATVEDRKFVRLWDATTGAPRGEIEHVNSVSQVTFTPEGRYVALGGIGGAMRVWDLTAHRELMAVTGHVSNLYGLALSPDGRRLASAASDCTTKLWDTQTGEEVLALRTGLHEHSPLAFSPDGADLAAVNHQNQVLVWSTRQPAKQTSDESPSK